MKEILGDVKRSEDVRLGHGNEWHDHGYGYAKKSVTIIRHLSDVDVDVLQWMN